MNPNKNNRKPKPTVAVEESLTEKSCDTCIPKTEVTTLVLEAVKKVENDAHADIAKLKKELADANSLLGRQRGDLEILRKKSEADRTVIAGLKKELDKVNSFGRWLYGINY